MTRRLLLLAAVALLAGCEKGEKRTPTFAVSGKVLLDGKPAEHASVIFHPLSGDAATPKPRGKVAADGSFTLTTYDGHDGAPAGDYRVTVELWLAGKGDEPPSNRLPPRFADPALSKLTATVAAGPTTLEPFHLKR